MPGKTHVFTSNRVILSGNDQPVPATILVDPLTGKIIDVKHGHTQRAALLDPTAVSAYTDAGDHLIMPGLVECVTFRSLTGYPSCL